MEILFILRVTIWSVFQNPVTYAIDEFNKWAWRSFRITRLQIGRHFVGQKKNEINRVTTYTDFSAFKRSI